VTTHEDMKYYGQAGEHMSMPPPVVYVHPNPAQPAPEFQPHPEMDVWEEPEQEITASVVKREEVAVSLIPGAIDHENQKAWRMTIAINSLALGEEAWAAVEVRHGYIALRASVVSRQISTFRDSVVPVYSADQAITFLVAGPPDEIALYIREIRRISMPVPFKRPYPPGSRGFFEPPPKKKPKQKFGRIIEVE